MSNPSNSPGADRARDDSSEAADRARREAGSAREEAKHAGRSAREEAGHMADAAREQARSGAEQGKEAAAGSLDDFAAAVGKAADELGERDQSMAAHLVREMANGLGDASRSIHGRGVDEIVRSVASFARGRPTTFLVGAALAGVALGRFARSSSEHDDGGFDHPGENRYRPAGEPEHVHRPSSYGEATAATGTASTGVPASRATATPGSGPASATTLSPGASTPERQRPTATPVARPGGSAASTPTTTSTTTPSSPGSSSAASNGGKHGD